MDEQAKAAKREYDKLYYAKNRSKKIKQAVAWRKDNIDKFRAYTRKSNKRYYGINKDQLENKRLLKVYGLSKEDRTALFESQENKCAICKSDTSGKPGFVIDHNHKTGSIRGILCNSCNLILGRIDENISTLESMISYLRKYEG